MLKAKSAILSKQIVRKQLSEVDIQRYSYEKVVWKYATNLQEGTHAEVLNLLHIFRTFF